MRFTKWWSLIPGGFAVLLAAASTAAQVPQTVAVWLFDEQPGLYPSKVLHDVGPGDHPMVLGLSGYIVTGGRFGNALEVREPRAVDFPTAELAEKIGLEEYALPPGRTVPPMTWHTADFAALMTHGDTHLRNQVEFARPTGSGLNLGSAADWTVEFWFQPVRAISEEGVVFEIGTGPRGENGKVTRLSLQPGGEGFTLLNQPGGVRLHVPSQVPGPVSGEGEWRHYAFVYSARESQLRHYVDGRLQPLPERAALRALEEGEEDYFSLGRDGQWQGPLPGRLDELRFSRGRVYNDDFTPPGSLAEKYLGPRPQYRRIAGLPLLFSGDRRADGIVALGSRKHLFVDDAIVGQRENITFRVNPPVVRECVIRPEGPFRKHLTVVEDEEGLIRIYNALDDDYLGVWVSRDGIHFEAPDVAPEYKGKRNILLREGDGDGTLIIDENAPPEHRWKYITGFNRRGVYLYTSPDGYRFTRREMALLPFRAATQNDVFWDDQRQLYVGYWRSGFPRTPGNYTQREFVMSEHESLVPPLPFTPVTAEQTHEVARSKRLSPAIPWYLDNGPLTPGKFGIEFPTVFAPDDEMDGASAGIYNPKAMKYPWAPDTYVAFPVFYFHYYEGYPGRVALSKTRGGGPTETQFAVSRDGVHWTRYPRPTYVGIGRLGTGRELDIMQTYMAQGMVRRGDEIWQYVFGDADYHTSAPKRTWDRCVYRTVQRFDGFVSAEAPYEEYGTLVTRPLTFQGTRLLLNIDTDAHGYALVGLLDEDGAEIPGFGIGESLLINGDFIEEEVRWLGPGGDVSQLQGRTVRVAFRMRGAKLYSMQFVDR
jgi:hypothetical protein